MCCLAAGSIPLFLTSSAAGTVLTFWPIRVACKQPYQMTWGPRWTSASMPAAEVDYGTAVCCNRGSLCSWAGVGKRLQRFLGHAANPWCRRGGGGGGLRVRCSGGFKWFHCSYDVMKGIPKPNVPRASNDKMADSGAIVRKGPVALLLFC